MTKELFSLHIADVSAFARLLGTALKNRHATKPEPPGQVELLNLIARTQGQRNWQALRAEIRRREAAQPPAATAAPIAAGTEPLCETARKALAHFDDQGRLKRWPVKFSVQKLVMWMLWTRFDAKRVYTEREVTAILKAANTFSDPVTLRRELINHRLMTRTPDCREYRKLAVRPDDETRALLSAFRDRCREAA